MNVSPSFRATAANGTPARIYAGLVTAAAIFVVCLTGWGLLHTARPSVVDRSLDTVIPHSTLLGFAASACVGGLLGALARRRRETPNVAPNEAASDLAELTGLPVLARLFPNDSPSVHGAAPKRQVRGQWLVQSAEICLCIAFTIALWGCFRQHSLPQAFLMNPFDAYVRAVQVSVSPAGPDQPRS